MWKTSSIVVAALALVLTQRVTATGFEERVDAEIRRLDGSLAKIDDARLPKDLQGGVKGNRDQLVALETASSPVLRLYRLREPFINAETLRFVSDHADATKSFDAFQTFWQSRRQRFEEKRPAAKGSLLQLALVQSGVNRAEKLFRASLPYGKVSAPWSGVYYLAEAEANLSFARFVESLSFPASKSTESRITAQRLRSAVDAIEGETIALFEKDPAGRTAIPVSARLKETRELLDQGKIEGATLMLLETRLGLSRRAGIAATSTGLASSKATDTIVDLYTAMASEDKEGETRKLIQESVLPFYFSLARSAR